MFPERSGQPMGQRELDFVINPFPLAVRLYTTRSPQVGAVTRNLGLVKRQKSLFSLKVVAEIINPVMAPVQFDGIKRQLRVTEATHICVLNFLLFIYP